MVLFSPSPVSCLLNVSGREAARGRKRNLSLKKSHMNRHLKGARQATGRLRELSHLAFAAAAAAAAIRDFHSSPSLLRLPRSRAHHLYGLTRSLRSLCRCRQWVCPIHALFGGGGICNRELKPPGAPRQGSVSSLCTYHLKAGNSFQALQAWSERVLPALLQEQQHHHTLFCWRSTHLLLTHTLSSRCSYAD